MANLKEIRNRIKSVRSTQQVTKAMKMVSAAKLRKAQTRIVQMRPYAAKLRDIIRNVTSAVNLADIPSKLMVQREADKVLILLVSSNRGLCGTFNSNLFKVLNQFIEETYPNHRAAGKLHMICCGSKGYDYYKKRGYQLVGKKEDYDMFSNLSFGRANEVVDYVFEAFENGTYDRVHLVYNEFKNVMVQNRKVEQFLPVAVEKGQGGAAGPKADYIFEPNREEILSDIIPRSLRVQFFRSLLESNAAEQGARMVAMDTATSNADELLRVLKLNYNKARQASITKEILEISAGANALAAD